VWKDVEVGRYGRQSPAKSPGLGWHAGQVPSVKVKTGQIRVGHPAPILRQKRRYVWEMTRMIDEKLKEIGKP
jgi:hypothetical protein